MKQKNWLVAPIFVTRGRNRYETRSRYTAMGYEQLEKSQSRISMFEFGDFFSWDGCPWHQWTFVLWIIMQRGIFSDILATTCMTLQWFSCFAARGRCLADFARCGNLCYFGPAHSPSEFERCLFGDPKGWTQQLPMWIFWPMIPLPLRIICMFCEAGLGTVIGDSAASSKQSQDWKASLFFIFYNTVVVLDVMSFLFV